MKALVIGATGATGTDLVRELLQDASFEEIHIFTRSEPQPHSERLHAHLVDFDRIEDWKEHLNGDVLFSVMGTTLKKAGSQEAQWKVDHTYQFEVARAARENGVSTMVLVSSAWADADSRVFYTRMKGRLEKDIIGLGFRSLFIMRPPSLIRKDTDRLGERISVSVLQALNSAGLLRSIRPMPTSVLAHAMIEMAKRSHEGTTILEPEDIRGIH